MPTARELLEQADALMRRNRERALEAERATLRFATEPPEDDVPQPPEAAAPIAVPGEQSVVPFAPSSIPDVEKPPTTVERASESLDLAEQRRDAVVPEAVVESAEPAPEIPELNDIVTIGTPWPLPHPLDDAPVADAVPGVVDTLDAREGEAPVEQESREESVADASDRDKPARETEVEPSDLAHAAEEPPDPAHAAEEPSDPAHAAEEPSDPAQPAEETPDREGRAVEALDRETAAAAEARIEESPADAASEPPEPAVAVPEAIDAPIDAPTVVGVDADAAARDESIETLAMHSSIESVAAPAGVAPLASEPVPSAAPSEKEPWRLWSLFSFGRKSADTLPPPPLPPPPATEPAVTETDIATVPPASATVALAEVPVEAAAPPEPTLPESNAEEPSPEPATEPSVESAIAGATAVVAAATPDDGVLPVPGAPGIEAAGPGPQLRPDPFQDNERWEALAEEIRMQVLQRIDIFTDTQLRDQLGVQLQPIVQRASAELVTTINEQVGRLIRAYIAEAIEREIDTWRRNNP